MTHWPRRSASTPPTRPSKSWKSSRISSMWRPERSRRKKRRASIDNLTFYSLSARSAYRTMNIKEDLDPADPNNPANDGGKPPAKVGEGGDNPEELKSRLANAEAVISDLKEFAGVKSVKEIKEKLKPPAPAPEKAPVQQKEQGEYVAREEIALFGQGYTPDEIEVAKRLATGKPLTEAVKDETAKAAIAGIRSARKTNDST